MQQGCPADLGIADAVRGLVLDELAGDTLQRLSVLEERDRQVERLEQPGLTGAVLGRGERSAHRLQVARRGLDLPRSCELEGGRRAERSVEVKVELGLRHRAREVAQRMRSGHVRPMVRRGPSGKMVLCDSKYRS